MTFALEAMPLVGKTYINSKCFQISTQQDTVVRRSGL